MGWNPLTAIRNAMDSSELDAKEKLVYIALVRRSDDDGLCRPSVDRIAKDTGLSRNSVMRATTSLAKKKWVCVFRAPRGGSANRYVLHNPSHPDTSLVERLVADGYQTSPTERPDQSHRGTPPVPQRDPKLPKNLPKERTQEVTQGARRRRRTADGEPPDPRVQPVLRCYHDAFKRRFGRDPTRAVLDFGRDGRRLKRDVPADYTADALVEAVKSFFEGRHHKAVTRNWSFGDFLKALPELMERGKRANGRHQRHSEPDSIDDLRAWQRG